jgi:hypothetical protein
MPNYEIGVYLTHKTFGSVDIEAESEAKALEIADEMYDNDEIELSHDKSKLQIMIEGEC